MCDQEGKHSIASQDPKLSDTLPVLGLDTVYAGSPLRTTTLRHGRGVCITPWFTHSFYWATAPAPNAISWQRTGTVPPSPLGADAWLVSAETRFIKALFLLL